MTTNNVAGILAREASASIIAQRSDGSWPGGVNGPYGHRESPVRVTAHRIVLLSCLMRELPGFDARQAIASASAYLIDPVHRPGGWTPLQREAPGLDRCNGLIGPAWTIEGLVSAAFVLGDTSLVELAIQLVRMHPFEERRGLWHRREVDGRDTGIDTTLNHQIWFCAAAAMAGAAAQDQSVLRNVDVHLRMLRENMGLHRSGLVRHAMEKRLFGFAPRSVARVLYDLRDGALLREKAIGYHMFNLYGLALIKSALGDHEFFHGDTVRRAVAATWSESWRRNLAGNRFGFPYNPVGWEAPFVLASFAPERLSVAHELLGQQFARSTSTEYGLADAQAADPPTAAARIYELARAPREAMAWSL